MDFATRSALVSGGAGGLGGATARRLVELGMGVVVFEPDPARAAMPNPPRTVPVKAIPAICAAPPGILTATDLPQITARLD